MKTKISNVFLKSIRSCMKYIFTRHGVFIVSILLITSGATELKAQKIWEVYPGDNYRTVFTQLQPGDELVFHEGIYTGSAGTIRNSGTPEKPIIIRGFGNGEARPVLLLESTGSNLLQINANNLIFDFLEFRSKYTYAIRIGSSAAGDKFENITIKNCLFYESGGGDISANASVAYDNIQIIDNYFIAPKTTPIYIGQHDGLANVTNFLFKGNVVDGSTNDGSPSTIGYGIQLKLNVTGGIIENNYITNTKGPCIMVYGAEDSDPDKANIIRNNIVVGSRNNPGIIAGGGPSTILNNITMRCNGGISIQNYGGRNLLHNIILNNNTAVCDRNYGMSFGNVNDITARDNVVITSNSSTAYRNNPNPGINNVIVSASEELEKIIQEELMYFMPAKNNLEEIWNRISEGPLSQAEVMEVIALILEYKIPLGGERDIVNTPLIQNPSQQVTIFPNPATDHVNLKINNGIAHSAEVSLYSITGKRVFFEKYSNTETISFSVKNYVPGIYFLNLNLDGEVVVKKLVLDKK